LERTSVSPKLLETPVTLSTGFDVIFVNMLLPWIADTQALLLRLQQLLAPNGLLLLSTLGPDTLKELRATWQTLDNLEHVNMFIDMHDLGDQLRALEFESVVLDRENIEVAFSDVPTLLHTLKVCGSVKQQPTQFVGQVVWQQLIKQYPQNSEGDIAVSGELIYVHVRAPKVEEESGVSYIPLSQLRRKSR
ncbi:MAG: methyltransferase domain-containing protein, partial [Gammaproteobacteria bacterium]|nr:methyltransferase domain-containing protein [Gammaproteobacteria bacterium]